MTDQELAQKMKDTLDAYGWTRLRFGTTATGFCLRGAALLEDADTQACAMLAPVIREQYGDLVQAMFISLPVAALDDAPLVMAFNDSVAERDDIDVVLGKVIAGA